MKIVSSRLSDISRRRNAYINKYNEQKSQRQKEVSEYKSAAAGYTDKIKEEIIQAIGNILLAPFGDLLNIIINKDYHNDYRITFKYSGTSSRDDYDYRGVPFSLSIRISRDGDNEGEAITAPSLEGTRTLSPEDYSILMAEIALFQRIDSMDWKMILSNAESNEPKSSDYVKTEDPGYLDTTQFDIEYANAMIHETQDKDLWVGVYITREQSFNPNSSYAKESDVFSFGWIRLISESPVYYFFNWLPDQGEYMGLQGKFAVDTVKYALRTQHKLKKQYFGLPKDTKVHFMTSEDLCGEELESLDD